ncbi:uncharacterized protein ASCRUDRAFT_71271 [Ascoidea rubescens DSM 1968]|uniref:Uncharacterized protein n=1 Tax=Ascoidea rubescens DSM 1968 TaxID=1344418 RepID=A0A1D2VDH6_9ASCO|nr:hypothetical protein ASCRUDRAFT_71271 [Ascoidea rubescens DSM 1968]ODV59758.1 hypothetical protein ASCRUDRAFT_71271 [Ascoidea rubescens DSM 1968]
MSKPNIDGCSSVAVLTSFILKQYLFKSRLSSVERKANKFKCLKILDALRISEQNNTKLIRQSYNLQNHYFKLFNDKNDIAPDLNLTDEEHEEMKKLLNNAKQISNDIKQFEIEEILQGSEPGKI